jgi:CMP-N-acetylneuraminic acid synthetase
MTDNCLAIIPARGDSKDIPKKNLQKIGDKTLFEWTLPAANGAVCVTDVVVSSYNQAVLEICRVKGANFLCRPSELATDITDSIVFNINSQRILKNFLSIIRWMSNLFSIKLKD